MPAVTSDGESATDRLRLPARCAAAAAARHAVRRGHRSRPSSPCRGAGIQYADVRALDELGVEHAVFTPETNGLQAIRRLESDRRPQADADRLGAARRRRLRCQDMVYGALAAKSADAERIVLIVDALPEHRFSGALAAERDAGLALRPGVAHCRRGRVPQSRRSGAAQEAGARSRGIAGRRSFRGPASTSTASRFCRCRRSGRGSCS